MVRDTLAYGRRHGLWPDPGGALLAACSGGPDSMALLDILQVLSTGLGFRLAAAHVHHGLRGEAADGDAAFVREACMARGIPLMETAVDAGALARSSGKSLEESARDLRHAFLETCAHSLGPGTRIALAHHRGDQAETLLLHLFRGAGLDGLSGMAPRQGLRIRPLLWASRPQILAYLARRGLSFREDETNREPVATRNRVRLDLLPAVERAFGLDPEPLLARTADRLRDDAAYLEGQAREVFADLAHGGAAPIPAAALAALPAALSTRVVRLVVARANIPGPAPDAAAPDAAVPDAAVPTPGRPIDLESVHVDAILSLCARHARHGRPGALDLPGGLRAVAESGSLSVEQRPVPLPSRPVPRCGSVAIPEVGGVLFSEPDEGGCNLRPCGDAGYEMPYNTMTWYLGDDLLPQAVVRSPGPRDRIRPPEHPEGTWSLKRYLVQRGLPLRQRDRLLLVAVGDRVLWIPGLVGDPDIGPGVPIRLRFERRDAGE